MATLFRSLAQTMEKVAGIAKRLEMIDIVAGFIRDLEDGEVEPAVSILLGRPFPRWSEKSLEVSGATLMSVLRRVADEDWSLFRKSFRDTGDVGSAVKAVFENVSRNKQASLFGEPLTILGLRKSFESLAGFSGSGSKVKRERLLEGLFGQASPHETPSASHRSKS